MYKCASPQAHLISSGWLVAFGPGFPKRFSFSPEAKRPQQKHILLKAVEFAVPAVDAVGTVTVGQNLSLKKCTAEYIENHEAKG
jgi:hypothetical protein